MTRTDVEASRPQAPGTAANRRGSSHVARRRLMVLPVALLLALAPAAPALAAAQPLNGYGGQTTPKPGGGSPGNGTSPSKTTKTPTTSTPSTEPAPATSSNVPTSTTTTSPKASSLPFTGFDLRWTVGGGVLLIAMGLSIVMVQRRQRHDNGR
jgi:hypothetical protein